MALRNPSNLYSGGAVVFDSSPYTNFAIQMLQKRQAKQEAVDQYFQQLATSVDDKGIRPEERQALLGMKDDFQKYYMQNRQAIVNPSLDGGRAQAEARQFVTRMGSLVNQSLLLQKDRDAFRQSSLRNNEYVWDDETMKEVKAADQPYMVQDETGAWVQNPQWRPLDVTALHKVKSLSTKEYDEYGKTRLGKFKRDDITTTYEPSPDDNLMHVPTTVSKFKKETLQAIAQEAENDYTNDRNLRYTFNSGHKFKDWSVAHEDEFNQYNDLYKSVTGRDITDERSLYAAMELLPASKPEVVQDKPVENRAAVLQANEASRKRIAAYEAGIREASQKKLIEWKHNNGYDKTRVTDGTEDFGSEYYDKEIAPRKGETELDDPIVMNALEKNSHMPNVVKSIGDGQYRAVFYKMDGNGNYLDAKGKVAKKAEDRVESELSYNVNPVQLKTMITAKYRARLGVSDGSHTTTTTKPAATNPPKKLTVAERMKQAAGQ